MLYMHMSVMCMYVHTNMTHVNMSCVLYRHMYAHISIDMYTCTYISWFHPFPVIDLVLKACLKSEI